MSERAEHSAEIDALVTKYQHHASNPTSRYVRAADVLADLRSLNATRAEGQTAVSLVMTALDTHRWKSMGVSSVECECGGVLHGPDDLTEFPADEAFRRHVAAHVVSKLTFRPGISDDGSRA